MNQRKRRLRWAATLVTLALLPAPAAFADPDVPDATYPRVALHAATAEGFAPKGWRIERRVEGDLNGDGKPDLLLILRDADPRNILKNDDGAGPNPFDTNPRMLVVALKSAGGGYDLALANHTLIPRGVQSNIDDVLEDAAPPSIAHGGMKIGLHLFANAGGWTAGSIGYAFRLQQGRVVLIGYESNMVQRNSGEVDTISANYLTGRLKLGKGRIETDGTKDSWKSLPSKRLLTLDEIGDGMGFDPTQPPK